MPALPRGGRPAEALAAIQTTIDAAWRDCLAEYGVTAGGADETELAEMVLADPSAFQWRVVDAALLRSRCTDCDSELGSGPVGCERCDQANAFRFGAIEVDRPATPPGTEHGLRVASAVARTRHRYSPRVRCGFELGLPDLLDGRLSSTPQAQALRAAINKLTDDELERVTTFDEVTALAEGR